MPNPNQRSPAYLFCLPSVKNWLRPVTALKPTLRESCGTRRCQRNVILFLEYYIVWDLWHWFFEASFCCAIEYILHVLVMDYCGTQHVQFLFSNLVEFQLDFLNSNVFTDLVRIWHFPRRKSFSVTLMSPQNLDIFSDDLKFHCSSGKYGGTIVSHFVVDCLLIYKTNLYFFSALPEHFESRSRPTSTGLSSVYFVLFFKRNHVSVLSNTRSGRAYHSWKQKKAFHGFCKN